MNLHKGARTKENRLEIPAGRLKYGALRRIWTK